VVEQAPSPVLTQVEPIDERYHVHCMSDQAFGWIVAVTNASGVRRYHVAVRNRVEAVSAVRRRVVGATDAHVEAVTMLSQRAVTNLLRLKPGEVVLIS
jgi:hypothetical protein